MTSQSVLMRSLTLTINRCRIRYYIFRHTHRHESLCTLYNYRSYNTCSSISSPIYDKKATPSTSHIYKRTHARNYYTRSIQSSSSFNQSRYIQSVSSFLFLFLYYIHNTIYWFPFISPFAMIARILSFSLIFARSLLELHIYIFYI